jgi:anti-sigma factor RsiW
VITCREFIEFLWKYLSGELEAAERFHFDAHLAICPPCVAYLRTYEETIRLGKVAFDRPDDPVLQDVPEELVAAILEARRASGA